MPKKQVLNSLCITSLYECRKHIGQHFQNISSGDKESNKKTYIKYKYIGF